MYVYMLSKYDVCDSEITLSETIIILLPFSFLCQWQWVAIVTSEGRFENNNLQLVDRPWQYPELEYLFAQAGGVWVKGAHLTMLL